MTVLARLVPTSVADERELVHFVASVTALCFALAIGADVTNQLVFFVDWPTALRSWAITSAIVIVVAIPISRMIGQAYLDLYRAKQASEENLATYRRVSEENLRLANLDALTQLPNRRRFIAEVDAWLSEAREAGRRLAVGLIDLDGFKPVNDVYGHPHGDQLLVLVSKRLQALCGADATLARLGGDEFGVIVPDVRNDAEVLEIGNSLVEALRQPFDLPGARVQIGGSMGFAVFPRAAQAAATLFERADYALYHAKQNQRGTVTLFSDENERTIREQSTVAQHLRAANFDDELSVVFQPIVDTRLGHVIGFEALARWVSPVLGEVRPDLFMPLAERHNMVSDLTLVLLRKTLAAAAGWPEHLRVSFNLSPYELASTASIARLLDTLKASDFPARRLDFEITETAVLSDLEKAKASIDPLKALGAHVSLDDFGCGYSSLAYVRRLPIDRIKIDRSFVAEIETDPTSQKIVRTIVDLCRNMELDCVAEGVETPAQLHILQATGCFKAQGYFFSKPMPAGEVAAFLVSHLSDDLEPRRHWSGARGRRPQGDGTPTALIA